MPEASAMAFKRFLSCLVQDDPVEVFASYWFTAFIRLHKEWRNLCEKDPQANVLVSFNRVYMSVGVAVERALGTSRQDRLKLIAEVDGESKAVHAQNAVARSNSTIIVGIVRAEQRCCCRRRRKASESQTGLEHTANQDLDALQVQIAPPERIKSSEIYELYRGAVGSVAGCVTSCRIWVNFPELKLCVAANNQPAAEVDCLPFSEIISCSCDIIMQADERLFQVNVQSVAGAAQGGGEGQHIPNTSEHRPLSIVGSSDTLRQFASSLQQLLESRDAEGRGVVMFIQRRLFQYLWRSQNLSCSEDQLFEAQAVLAFNLDVKDGISYLKRTLGKKSNDEIGEWLAQVSTLKGGLDPTMLGAYFSRKDALPVFEVFMSHLDFSGSDILAALRQLFDTFKPGGEGQVIARILESFSETYFSQWQSCAETTLPKTAFANADTVLQVAMSLIMLNTGLHIATKKIKKHGNGAEMTLEEYIKNTRHVASSDEVPDDALQYWYDMVSKTEISVEPMPRAPFSKLPVRPDIEGWLVAVLDPQTQIRYWAVLALQRLYLFTDSGGDVEPEEAIDLKTVNVVAVAEDAKARRRFHADLTGKTSLISFFAHAQSDFAKGLFATDSRAFELQQRVAAPPGIIRESSKRIRTRLAFVAESPELAEKWVNLTGPT